MFAKFEFDGTSENKSGYEFAAWAENSGDKYDDAIYVEMSPAQAKKVENSKDGDEIFNSYAQFINRKKVRVFLT